MLKRQADFRLPLCCPRCVLQKQIVTLHGFFREVLVSLDEFLVCDIMAMYV